LQSSTWCFKFRMCETNLDKTSKKTTPTPKIMDATCNSIEKCCKSHQLLNSLFAYIMETWCCVARVFERGVSKKKMDLVTYSLILEVM
jgi:hypothetical protein